MARSIMIQGTMSNAGKSLIAAGLCRIFAQDGYKTAPFKSQNMALNSFITEDGLEMGRAQVVQAEAAGVKPSAYMNPILLKPTTDIGSQVIVNGVSIGNMRAKDYFAYKKQLIPQIMEAYKHLDEEYDVIVIEGAGSPAEINLKSDDIVNMGLAAMVDAPVLLAGDIDRGGVFAQLYGTVELLEPEERNRIKGLIINKFRGDKTILEPGLRQLEDLCRIPVAGVVPYMNVDIEDEDSLSERMSNEKVVGQIDLVVVRLPRISNFTDFNIFESIPGVSVRYVKRAAQLGNPDLILLPGTKNTMSDLAWMRQSGMEAAVLKAHAAGCPIFGICGGYQMLGEELSDPFGVEDGGTMRGMGLLPMHTVFTEEKTRTRVNGQFLQVKGDLAGLSDIAFSGYEIHMGQSVSDGKLSMLTKISDHCDHVGHTSEGSADGGAKTLLQSGSAMEKCEGAIGENVYGSYVHGIFDAQEVVNAIVKALAEKKGIDPAGLAQMDYAAYKETQYDKMADILRKHLDMEQIYRILDAGV